MTRCEACRWMQDGRCVEEDLGGTVGWYRKGGTTQRTAAGVTIEERCQRFAPATPGMEVIADAPASRH